MWQQEPVRPAGAAVTELIVTRAVDFLEVHRLVAPILTQIESWPAAGTLPWQQLANTDPAKWAAILDAARYGALHMQLRQEHLADAGKKIAASREWADVCADSRRHAQAIRSGAYIPRRIA